MNVIVVVLNWNNEADTAACLESLVADGLSLGQIVLVDNASADGSGDRLFSRFQGVRYIQTGANLGYAGGNNVGAREALAMGADWVMVLNNDTVVESGMVRALLSTGESNARVGVVSPKIVRFDDPTVLWFDGGYFSPMRALGGHFREGESDVLPDVRPAAPVTFLTGCCLLIRASIVATNPELFRADFFLYVEDTEFCVRVQRQGWELWYQPAARLQHRVPPFGAPLAARHIVLRDRNRRRLVRAHYGWLDRARFALWFYPTRVVQGAGYFLKGDYPRARAIIRGSLER